MKALIPGPASWLISRFRPQPRNPSGVFFNAALAAHQRCYTGGKVIGGSISRTLHLFEISTVPECLPAAIKGIEEETQWTALTGEMRDQGS